MLKIRLSRTGKKKQPSYRIVVADVNSKRDGRVVERIGYYNPLVDPIEYRIKEDRALHWLSVGAQPTDAVNRLLVKQGTVERLGRLRSGEDFDALVTEFTGEIPVAAAEAAAVADVVTEEEEVVEEAEESVAEVEEAVAESTEEVTDVEEEAEDAEVEEVEEVADADDASEESKDAE